MNKLISAVLLFSLIGVVLIMIFLLWHSRSLQQDIATARDYDPLESIIHDQIHQFDRQNHQDHAYEHEEILNRFRRRPKEED